MTDENPYSPPEAEVDVEMPSQLASRGARLGGALIDGIVAMLIIFPIIFLGGFMEAATTGGASLESSLYMGLIGIGVFMALNGYLLAKYGQTIGKRVVGTRIVDYQNGKILSLGKVFLLRYLPFWIASQVPIVNFIVGLVNPLFIFGSERRCLHDYVAGTKVIVATASDVQT